jgi:hypothetical protein
VAPLVSTFKASSTVLRYRLHAESERSKFFRYICSNEAILAQHFCFFFVYYSLFLTRKQTVKVRSTYDYIAKVRTYREFVYASPRICILEFYGSFISRYTKGPVNVFNLFSGDGWEAATDSSLVPFIELISDSSCLFLAADLYRDFALFTNYVDLSLMPAARYKMLQSFFSNTHYEVEYYIYLDALLN